MTSFVLKEANNSEKQNKKIKKCVQQTNKKRHLFIVPFVVSMVFGTLSVQIGEI